MLRSRLHYAMGKAIRNHIRGNLIGYIALFFALSTGTAVALTGSNTVQSDDLGPGAQVTAPDVAANAVNGSDVINDSLTGADTALAYSRPQASSPVSGYDETSFKEVTVDCPPGYKVTGGGYVLFDNATNAANLTATRSYAIDADSWLVRAEEADDSAVGAWQLTAVANCLNG